jgi:2'-5' RNA ligase
LAASAIVLLVPELEPLVGRWRDRYDPAASQGVGAHVTLLFPFKAAERIQPGDLESLGAFFAAERLPTLEFAGVCAFRNLVHLPVEPAGAVSGLIDRLARRFPETPPYEGKIPVHQIVPHVTVAYTRSPKHQASLAAAICRAALRRLPVRVSLPEAVLLAQDDAGIYNRRAAFRFAGSSPMA